ncbi:hypothetical protein [Gemmatimonas sp.]|jgi:hypothetical protein|uniref:hypothetical protein n=1 Tax=Gemmatimonas sp. TaxID=1962908 RepID=UPI0025BBAC1C|nr:hypothetical protein [Gemmatimonas sp.]MCA2992884.1 hypothetical protein [Gemmatimonas sp.]
MKIDISQLDEAQLLALNQQIVARLNYLQEARTHHQMLNFKVGERVRFHPPGHDPKAGVIVKYNRKTVTVVTDDQHHWNVAPVFLTRVVEPEESVAENSARVIPLPGKL